MGRPPARRRSRRSSASRWRRARFGATVGQRLRLLHVGWDHRITPLEGGDGARSLVDHDVSAQTVHPGSGAELGDLIEALRRNGDLR
jgi:hypothetical protein